MCGMLPFRSYGSSVGLVLVASCARKVAVIKQQSQKEMFTESFMKTLWKHQLTDFLLLYPTVHNFLCTLLGKSEATLIELVSVTITGTGFDMAAVKFSLLEEREQGAGTDWCWLSFSPKLPGQVEPGFWKHFWNGNVFASSTQKSSVRIPSGAGEIVFNIFKANLVTNLHVVLFEITDDKYSRSQLPSHCSSLGKGGRELAAFKKNRRL